MSVLTSYVCDECGSQSRTPDRWLALRHMDITDMAGEACLFSMAEKLDFCSPGCLLRWISKAVAAPRICDHQQLDTIEDSEEMFAIQASV